MPPRPASAGRGGRASWPKTFSGSVKNPPENFPPKTLDKVDAARTEVRDAFRADFVEYVQKKVIGAARTSTAH